MSEPTMIQKRILSFFRRTEGAETLAPIYNRAAQAFPNLPINNAIVAYWQKCIEDERRHAAEVGGGDEQDLKAVQNFVGLQFVP